MQRIRKEIPTLDVVIALYLVESLKCFRNGTFVASAVMLGVAAEQMMLVLRKAVYDALDTQCARWAFHSKVFAALNAASKRSSVASEIDKVDTRSARNRAGR